MSCVADSLPAWQMPFCAHKHPKLASHSNQTKALPSLLPCLQHWTETKDLVGQAASSAFCKAKVSVVVD